MKNVCTTCMSVAVISIVLLSFTTPFAAAQSPQTTPYTQSDSSRAKGSCPLMSRTAFEELQKWNAQQWLLNNTSKRYTKMYGSEGMVMFNKEKTAFLEGQKIRRTEYVQAYSLLCNEKNIKGNLTNDYSRAERKAKRLTDRVLRATIQRSYNQAVLKNIRNTSTTQSVDR